MKTTLSIALIFIISISYAQINWEPINEVASSIYGNFHPRVVMNGSGEPVVIWNGSSEVQMAKWNGTDFTVPVSLSAAGMTVAGQSWMGPDIDARGDTIYVVYKEGPEGSTTSYVWSVKSTDGGASFGTPVRVDYVADSLSRFPTVTIDELGNPIVGFMKFNPSFGDARWVVAKSTDMGQSFSPDVLASGWSSPTSEVCDCCPGQMTTDGNTTVMMYRDNNSDIRDTWAGISTDNGGSFTGGMNVDQQGWYIQSCPSSGPDGFILGDTLYTTYMSGASGASRVYYNKSSVSAMNGSQAIPLNASAPGLTQQNYPRVSYSNDALAFVWQQSVSGSQELAIQFTENINNGLNTNYEVVVADYITNTDVVLENGVIFVVWEDPFSGTVKYRRGTYGTAGATEMSPSSMVNFSPNPTNDVWNIQVGDNSLKQLELMDTKGKVVYQIAYQSKSKEKNHVIDASSLSSGVYYLRLSTDQSTEVIKLVKR